MKDWQILYLVVAILVILYAVGFVLTLVFLLNFRAALKKNLVALSVLFAEKKEVLLSLYALFDKAAIPLDDPDKESAAKVRWLKTEVMRGSDVLLTNNALNDLERRLAMLSASEKYIQVSEDYIAYVNTLQDLDSNYRRVVAIFNTAVNGYEYWRKVLLYRPWFWLFGLRKRHRIS